MVGLTAAVILLLTIVSSVTLTLLVVRRPSAIAGGPNALQRWFSRHEGARNVAVILMTVLAFVPALLSRGLKAAGESAVGWTRRKLVGEVPDTVTTVAAPRRTIPPEARMRGGTPVSAMSGMPTGATPSTEPEAEELTRPVIL
jgi:hypothetical protein